jgi:hypothetical protein
LQKSPFPLLVILSVAKNLFLSIRSSHFTILRMIKTVILPAAHRTGYSYNNRRVAFFLFGALAPILDQALGAAIKATESASYQIVNTYNYPDYRLVQFNLAVLSHYSYMIISGNEALVVDPGRDISAYLDLAKKEDEIRELFHTWGERGEVFIS